MPKIIILAAGQGTRLRPYTLDRPKCLVEVDGRSLLDRQLDVLQAEGVKPIVLVGGYRSDMLRRPDTVLRLNPRFADTNMVWTLFCAEEELEGEVVVAYGDIVYSRTILRALLDSSADIAVTIDLDWEVYWRSRSGDPIADAETLKLAPDGGILELGLRPKSLTEIEGQYIGLMKFSTAGVEDLRRAFHEARVKGWVHGKLPEKAYMTDLLQTMVESGYRVQSVPVRGDWVEVDTVRDLESAITRSRLAAIAQE